ncbi:MAG TPA: c-type cytochrome [Elusimicrobiota bacterium]|nr:c-type cytochrome [Elusimicrobiota bacterium]
MNRRSWAALLLYAAGLAGVLAFSPRRAPAAPAAVDRGRYLVEGVAMCGECHTPRDARGLVDESRELQGAPIWITPVRPRPDWAQRAPALAGLESYTDEQAETVLEKGVGPNGLPLQAPMHDYRMSPEDAKAVIAYLRSLPSPR